MNKFEGVANTLFVPLVARIAVSKEFPEYFMDKKALELEPSLKGGRREGALGGGAHVLLQNQAGQVLGIDHVHRDIEVVLGNHDFLVRRGGIACGRVGLFQDIGAEGQVLKGQHTFVSELLLANRAQRILFVVEREAGLLGVVVAHDTQSVILLGDGQLGKALSVLKGDRPGAAGSRRILGVLRIRLLHIVLLSIGHPLFYGIFNRRNQIVILALLDLVAGLASHIIAVGILGNGVVGSIDREVLSRADPIRDAPVFIVVIDRVGVVIEEILVDVKLCPAVNRQRDILRLIVESVLRLQMIELRVDGGCVVLMQSVGGQLRITGNPVVLHRICSRHAVLGVPGRTHIIRPIEIRVDQDTGVQNEIAVDCRGLDLTVVPGLPDHELLGSLIGQVNRRAIAGLGKVLLNGKDRLTVCNVDGRGGRALEQRRLEEDRLRQEEESRREMLEMSMAASSDED